VTTLESRVAFALRHYATMRPADMAQLIRELYAELHATQAAWGEHVARMDTLVEVLSVPDDESGA
jgi:hypothetical protein